MTSRLTMEIDPSVTPPDLTPLYRAARHQVITGPRPRALDTKTLHLAHFVADWDLSLRPDQRPPTWAKRMARWNEVHNDTNGYPYPDKAVKQFARDARRARDLLLNPPYTGGTND